MLRIRPLQESGTRVGSSHAGNVRRLAFAAGPHQVRPTDFANERRPMEPARVFGDGRTPVKLPDGSSIVVPNRRLLYFNPNAFRNRVISAANPSNPTQQIIQNDVYWYGTAPRFLDDLRGFGINNTNLTVTRMIRIRERYQMELRAEAVNAFNRTEFGVGGIDRGFGGTNLNPGAGTLGATSSANFGTADITNIGRTPRYLQLGLRIQY